MKWLLINHHDTHVLNPWNLWPIFKRSKRYYTRPTKMIGLVVCFCGGHMYCRNGKWIYGFHCSAYRQPLKKTFVHHTFWKTVIAECHHERYQQSTSSNCEVWTQNCKEEAKGKKKALIIKNLTLYSKFKPHESTELCL